MAKRIQKKIKQFRGEKRAIKQAADEWMAGSPDTETVAAKQQRMEPAFQVDVLPEAKKLAAVQTDDEDDDEGNGDVGTYDLVESEDEGAAMMEAQLVTPSAKRPLAVDVPTSVQQYKAIIKNYQAQLEHAERQIRAISKTSHLPISFWRMRWENT